VVWCGVFLLNGYFIIYLINMKNRIYLVVGGYFLIKEIKWELIRIKGELSEN